MLFLFTYLRIATTGLSRLSAKAIHCMNSLSLDGPNYNFDHFLRITKENKSLELLRAPDLYKNLLSDDNFSSLAVALRNDNKRIGIIGFVQEIWCRKVRLRFPVLSFLVAN